MADPVTTTAAPKTDAATRAKMRRVDGIRQASADLAAAAYAQGHRDGSEGRSADRESDLGLHEAEDRLVDLCAGLHDDPPGAPMTEPAPAAPEDFAGDLAPEVRSTVVGLLRDLARDWQSSDLMDAAAYFEGTL